MRADTLALFCDRVLRWGLVFLIVFTPLAFGTVERWSIAIMEWGIWTLILVAFLRAGLGTRDNGETRRFRTGLEIPVVLFAGFCSLQMVPLPIDWLRNLSPRTVDMYSIVDVGALAPTASAREMARTDRFLSPSVPHRRPVSLNPVDTGTRLLLLVSFAGLFGLVAWWSRRFESARFLMLAVTITAFAVSLFGLVQYLTWNGRLYWFRRIPSTSAFGPFVNHNHFAGYVGMVIPIALSFVLYAIERRRFQKPGEDLFSEQWGRAGLALFGASLLVVALFFSLSRGGILSSAMGGLVFFMLVSRRLASRTLTWSVAGVLVVVAVSFIAWIGADVVSDQIGSYGEIGNEASFRSRAIVWKSMIENIGPLLATGSGLGTFEESFAPFTPVGSGLRWDRAHNDYLELLWETGIIGGLLFLVGVAVFVRRYWWRSLRAHDGPQSLFQVAVAVSLLTIALHSVVDFNLQIGANGFLFAIVSGILVGMQLEAADQRGAR